eukprot:CAMPEP_0197891628 /NCGR_PEP_ID=MMETSP1439-20131203/29141_1 /TAXON_ID=66791 /ORGANISM="Gonyaulax spinifera, Strain CCMP409" /LENGTH=58 /DNA_ID=CAMNT_0043511745 /DNA_START=86 /DNA_END=259 /DNA_ORIENTATION=-
MASSKPSRRPVTVQAALVALRGQQIQSAQVGPSGQAGPGGPLGFQEGQPAVRLGLPEG